MDEMTREQKLHTELPRKEETACEDGIVVAPKPFYSCVKRLFDILVALVCLTVGLPVYLIIALAIFVDDPGNPLFVQTRVGKNGKTFRMVKFRTMYRDAEKCKEILKKQNEYDSVHFKIAADPHILRRTGRFLRRTSLDEIPQAWNLLIGSMTVIGPRPFIPEEQKDLPMDRLAVKPGLSCYWQLANKRGLTDREQVELDYRYIKERSFRTDLKIIGMTVKSVFKGENC